MNSIQKRFIMFIFGCITTRLYITYLSKTSSIYTLRNMGYLALLPAIGFFIIYTFGLRKSGPEVLGKNIWWNNLRPVHMTLYLIFSYMAITGNKNSWVVLALDSLLGLVAFLNYHYTTGNFRVLNE